MEYFNPIRFGQQFGERVANPTEMILLKRERREKKEKSDDPLDRDAMENVLGNEVVSAINHVINFCDTVHFCINHLNYVVKFFFLGQDFFNLQRQVSHLGLLRCHRFLI